MHVAVEMSLYPLTGEFIPPILDFIARLKAQPGLSLVTNSMSTQVSGDYDRVFDALKSEIRNSFNAPHRAVLVMKVLGGAG
jgi:uncharacterized protein YqgV (UPF0045/DUF77 family)